jgi:hypothetical protein
MARAVYSVLLGGNSIAGGGLAEFPLPDGFTYVVRDIQATFITASGSALALQVTANGLIIALMSCPLAFALTAYWEGRVVAPGGSSLIASVSGAGGSVDVSISGYQLVLP